MMPRCEEGDAFVAAESRRGVRILGRMETLSRSFTAQDVSADVPASGRSGERAIRMAFLLSRYPAISHTFFLQEVLGLRARGMHLETASINAPDRALSDLPAVEAAEAGTTFYVKAGGSLKLLVTVLTACLQSPAALIRGLRALLAIRGLTLKQRGFWLFYLAEAMLVGRWMQKRRLDHLHVHFGGAVASVGMLATAAWRLPFSLTIHGPEELLNVDAYQLREKIAAADFVLCISDFCRSQLCQLTEPAMWHKFRVVRLGVDPLILTPPPRPMLVDESRVLEIVCTGRLVPAKGHRVLLEALSLLRERGILFSLTVIGGGPERVGLEQFVAEHGLGESVVFTSALSHPQTLAHVRRADIFALASFAEGIPVALMEAMSLGIPCVSTTIAGIPELIRSGHDGLLVAPSNAGALAEALECLATDAKLRRTMGNNARQRIISQYNLPLNQELLAQTFEELAGRHEARKGPSQ